MSEAHPPATVFLDRDGVLNVKAAEGDYILAPAAFRWLPGAVEAVQRLASAGTRLVVVTNQRGVALGHMSDADLDAVHARMAADLAHVGVRLEAVYACTHADGQCDCRKPGISLFQRALTDMPGIDLATSAVVGDSLSDMEAGTRLGCATYLIAATEDAAAMERKASRRGIRVDAAYPSLASLVADGFGLGPAA